MRVWQDFDHTAGDFVRLEDVYQQTVLTIANHFLNGEATIRHTADIASSIDQDNTNG
jgi:hypothetical protein